MKEEKIGWIIDLKEEIRRARILKDNKRLTNLAIYYTLLKIEDRLKEIKNLVKKMPSKVSD
jgi:hypothetical protein